MIHKKQPQPTRNVQLALFFLYLFTHLLNLTRFPIFADESIYIRWSQLIIDDWHQYLFFPMNDGKTPLFIWILVPFQFLFHDQLFAARIVSVLIGLLQMFVVKEIVRRIGGRPKTQIFSMILIMILPFWYFHHRVALMDGLLTLLFSLVILGVIHCVQNRRVSLPAIVTTGIFFGLSFWTKIPALFFLPVLPLFAFLPKKRTFAERLPSLLWIGASAVIGIGIFALLRISPSFGQLFHRGADFTYPIADVLFHGKWLVTIQNFPSYFYYFIVYLTPPIFFLAFAGVFSKTYRRTTVCLLLAAFVFAFPFMFFGKMVYARYLFPSALFLTLSSALSLQGMYDRFFRSSVEKEMWHKTAIGVAVALVLANAISNSFLFMGYSLFQTDLIPFVSSDRAQYLEDWSSGHGISETVEFIQKQAQTKKIAVATEGRFGTLPDGLLLYFHRQNLKNIYIEGTGEYPVKDIPYFFLKKAVGYDQVILVVNSDRMHMISQDRSLIFQVCRPNHASCLQVWDITHFVKNEETKKLF